MRRLLLGIALGLIAGCGSTPPASVTAPLNNAPRSMSAPSSTCEAPLRLPFSLDGIPGITVVSRDRATIAITNGTDRAYSYRVAGWEPARLDTGCARIELETARGPIGAGRTVNATLSYLVDRADIPITVAFWDAPCGEACTATPIAGVLVERSPIEPGQS
jgi:hypothetical protein